MIIIITGATHTGKTALSQKLLEKYKYPYLSVDHLKMGLIRSKNTMLTPLSSDRELTEYLWPITCEIIKTAIENNQNLIVEGCYVPACWKDSFSDKYLKNIKCVCLVMSKSYIEDNFELIKEYANIIEKRMDDSCITKEALIKENEFYLKEFSEEAILIDSEYKIDFNL